MNIDLNIYSICDTLQSIEVYQTGCNYPIAIGTLMPYATLEEQCFYHNQFGIHFCIVLAKDRRAFFLLDDVVNIALLPDRKGLVYLKRSSL